MKAQLSFEAELDELFGKKNQRISPGIESVKKAASYLPNMNSASSVLIGGTNGKGTTSGMLWHMLSCAGLNSGLYTSPHIAFFSERIRLSNFPVDDAYLIEQAKELKNLLPEEIYAKLSFFDLSTLMAKKIFAMHQTDWDVYEVGLGGRWDSTNGFDHDGMAIVSISMDHIEWLGDNEKKIAEEKLGIVRSEKPLFWGMSDGVQLDVDGALLDKQSQISFPTYKVKEFVRYDDLKINVHINAPFGEMIFKIPEWVKQQSFIVQENFKISSAMFWWICCHEDTKPILQRLGFQSSQDLFLCGIARFAAQGTPWPMSLSARFQNLDLVKEGNRASPNLILDVCHNIASVEQFVNSMHSKFNLSSKTKVPGIVSILKDKDIGPMLLKLSEVLDPIILFQVQGDRTITVDRIKEAGVHFPLFDDFAAAWEYAKANWKKLPEKWAVCGSFYGVGEVFRYFEVEQQYQFQTQNLQGIWR